MIHTHETYLGTNGKRRIIDDGFLWSNSTFSFHRPKLPVVPMYYVELCQIKANFWFFRGNRKYNLHNFFKISYINERAFRGVGFLTELDLCANAIQQLPENTFLRFAKTLRKINLEDNLFATMPTALRPLMSLEHLNLNHNRLMELDFLLRNLYITTYYIKLLYKHNKNYRNFQPTTF